MKITALAYHPEDISSWNPEGSGNPGVMLFANAVQVWATAQDRAITAEEAALAFNVTPELVREAVDHHPFMFLTGDVIEHEGE